MLLQILGSAAGGGSPQWNCGCPNCRLVREGSDRIRPRSQSSIAVRGSQGPWFLVNVSPDVRLQLEDLRGGETTELRSNPVAGVILTDAEIDHTAGLIVLRESAEPLSIYATDAVRHSLTVGFPAFEVLERYCGVRWTSLEPGGVLDLGSDAEPALKVEPFAVPGDAPLYMRGRETIEEGATIGLTFRDPVSDHVATYVPGMGSLGAALLNRFEASDVILVDGTFWTNDELAELGIRMRSALDMGHLPLSGPDGSLVRLRELTRPRKVLIHINNTNPILVEDSPERRAVEEAGVEVAHDGMVIEI